MSKSKFELAYISRNGSTWTCVYSATKQANYCCIPLSPKFSVCFFWVHLLLFHLTCYWMYLTIFSLPEMPLKSLLAFVQRSVCAHPSPINNLRCLTAVLLWCSAILPSIQKEGRMSLLSLSLISQVFFDQSCSEIFVGHPTSRTIVFSIYILSLSLKPNKLALQKQLEVSLLLSWTEFLSSEIKIVCFPLLSVHNWPLTLFSLKSTEADFIILNILSIAGVSS